MRNDTQLPEHSPAPAPALDPSNLTVPSDTPYLDANGAWCAFDWRSASGSMSWSRLG